MACGRRPSNEAVKGTASRQGADSTPAAPRSAAGLDKESPLASRVVAASRFETSPGSSTALCPDAAEPAGAIGSLPGLARTDVEHAQNMPSVHRTCETPAEPERSKPWVSESARAPPFCDPSPPRANIVPLNSSKNWTAALAKRATCCLDPSGATPPTAISAKTRATRKLMASASTRNVPRVSVRIGHSSRRTMPTSAASCEAEGRREVSHS
mmetsp:Transcript_72165/g.182536  ORF Transcript_72165/g.182536 Transcript_72165/m.182536 type:complete len:212 (+) Transcript_72165:1497-2132(+)